jgi:Lon-like protease
VAVGVLVLLLAGLWFMTTWHLHYLAFYPGETEETVGRVSIDGAEVFPPEGSLLFVTVRSRDSLTPLEWIAAKLDPAVDIYDRDLILRGRTSEERQADNLEMMLGSQDTAELVALEAVGFDVVSGAGAQIVAVADGLAADGVLDVGDVVTAIDGTPIEFGPDLAREVRARQPGDEIELTVRGDEGAAEAETRTVVLGDAGGVARLGVEVGTQDFEMNDPPIDVEFESGNIGGPSAGLAWTLTIIDELTPGELTGGARVAMTGEIEINGDVGAIGAVRQKVNSVRDAGIDYFLVPEDNAADAIEEAGDDLQIVPVGTLDDALEFLAGLGGNGLALGSPVLQDTA